MHAASGRKDQARVGHGEGGREREKIREREREREENIHRPNIIRLLKRALISCRILQSRLPLRGIKKL